VLCPSRWQVPMGAEQARGRCQYVKMLSNIFVKLSQGSFPATRKKKAIFMLIFKKGSRGAAGSVPGNVLNQVLCKPFPGM